MTYQLSKQHIDAAFAGESIVVNGREVTFEVVDLGKLSVTSGRIAASDPLVCPKPEPFNVVVPNGEHVCQIAIAKFANGDERIAFARLKLLEETRDVVAWELALQEGQDIAELSGEDHFFGYGVDAGTGCFMDAETGALLETKMDDEPDYFEEIIAGMESTYKHTRSWLNFRPNDNLPHNVICFSSGFGDGAYPSFFGLSSDRQPVAIITDFLTLD